MQKKILLLFLAAACTLAYQGCGKDDPDPPDPCMGVTVAVTAVVTNATTGQSNGSLAASATGGTGFTFSINGGAYQNSGNFTALAAGNYTISAKNSNGCVGSAQFTVGSINPCAGVTITVSSTSTTATPCASPNTGSITASATGSTGFTYSLNNGTFQTSGIFNNLAAGTYSIVAKDNNGCTSAASSVTINPTAQGQLFAAVKGIIQGNCLSCHNANNSQGGMNFSVDCNIVANRARIKARAVDAAGTPNQMPPPPNPALSQADRDKIVEWINAGGTYGN